MKNCWNNKRHGCWKKYTVHSALNRLIANKDYRIDEGFALSNAREVRKEGGITYMPVYYVMFLDAKGSHDTRILL